MNLVSKMLMTLTIIGILSGGLLSQLSSWAQPKIEEHRRKATQEAVFLVQPQAKDYKKVEVDFELYEVFDDSGQSIGYSIPWNANGYQGNIRVMIGVKKDLKTIVGINVLEQTETPGLGTKIMEEPFTSQFVDLVADPKAIAVKGLPASKPGEVQTITGATISSKAIIDIVNGSLEKLRNSELPGAES